ncbi:hypothetical protein [Ilumatobacter nonamiensis]|uniref:hypothetical protein n=1 Tax=Ilumatobacter nonamiensis TaxID=467093 RepID=UPI00034A6BC8|nr:hypothetical protein [Ilumatobacter nonamiensis]
MNWWKVVLVGLAAAVVGASPAAAAPEPPPPAEPATPSEPAPAPSPATDFVTPPSALIQIPSGCPAPEPAELAFVGTVLAKDEFVEKGTVRFQIDHVRAGSAIPYAVDGVIDVRYGPDSQYIDIDDQVLVSAAVDANIGALASKVAPESPLFGGDAVVGLEDTEVICPVVDDPVQTINVDGTPIESSLFTPLLDDKRLLLSTIAVPAAIVGVVLIGLVLLRRGIDLGFRGIFALGRAAVMPTGDHRAARVRRHVSDTEAHRLGLDIDDIDDDDDVADADDDAADSDRAESKLIDV